MSGVGVDPEAVAEALAEAITSRIDGVNVFAFPPASVPFPALGIFEAETLVSSYDQSYAGSDGELNFVIRTVFTSGFEDARRALYRMVSKGAGHPESIVDALMADRTLLGRVRSVAVQGGATVTVGGDEGAPLHIASIPVAIACKRKGTP